MPRLFPRVVRAVVVAALAGLLLTVAAPASATPRPADVDDFTFASLDVDYTLGRAADGTSTLRVVETYVAQFPEGDQNRGMRRIIPTTYDGHPVFPHLVSITDGDGRPRPAETDEEDGGYGMTSRADDYVHGAQTYVFTYTLENVTRYFARTDVDEFYWQVNGLEWRQPFAATRTTLHVDPGLASALNGAVACYRGSSSSTDRCDVGIEVDPSTGGARAVTASTGALAAGQTMTIAVGFAPHTFAAFDGSPFASAWGWLQLAAFLVVLGAIAAAVVVRVRRLADEPGRPTIVPEYTPPAGVDALLAAVLLQLPSRAIPAEVLEQAVGGSIRIVEGRRRLFGGTTLLAELVDPSRADEDGRMILAGLFGAGAAPGATFEFGRTDTRLSSSARSLLAWASKELHRRGYRVRVPAARRAVPILCAVVGAALTVATGIAALDAGVVPVLPLALLVASVVALFVVIGIVARRPLTAAGAEVRDHLEGLKAFIAWAEADRIRMLQSPQGAERIAIDPADARQVLRLYESLLPYAVVFGQERQWAERLAVLYGSESPTWYSGSQGFSVGAFTAGIGSLSSSASSSSSTGGSGGGGSAGGGGGGGGGGGV